MFAGIYTSREARQRAPVWSQSMGLKLPCALTSLL